MVDKENKMSVDLTMTSLCYYCVHRNINKCGTDPLEVRYQHYSHQWISSCPNFVSEFVGVKNALDYKTLYDWYIASIDETKPPCWTPEHIEELVNDFYLIPKRKEG